MKQIITSLLLLLALFSQSYAQISSSYLTVVGDTSMVCQSSRQLHARPFSSHDWSSVSVGSSMSAFDFLTDSVGYAVGSAGAILKTIDAGTSWSALNSGSTTAFIGVKAIDAQRVVALSTTGVLFRSSDAGTTWTQTATLSVSSVSRVYIQSFDTIFASSGSVLFKTVNGGQSWTSSKLYKTTITTIYFTSSKVGFVAYSGTQLYKTTDGGNSWRGVICVSPDVSRVINWPSTVIYSISFMTQLKGIAVGSNSQIFYTHDGGNSWEVSSGIGSVGRPCVYQSGVAGPDSIISLSGSSLNYVRFVTPEVGYIRGAKSSKGFVLKTVDGGKVWKWIYLSSGNKVLASFFNSEFRGVISGGANNVLVMTASNLPDNGTYQWIPALGLSNPNIANPILIDPIPGDIYTVTRTEGDFVSQATFVLCLSNFFNAITGSSKHIGCSGSTLLDSIATSYKGSGQLHYKWTPSTGLDNDTLCSPIASPISSTVYTLTVTGPSGCTTSVSLPVVIDPLSVNAGTAKTIVCGGSIKMDSVLTNYSGTARLKYKWTPSTGLSSDTIATPIASPTSTTTYTVAVTASSGCSASGKVIVTVTPLTVDVTNNLTTSCGSPAQLGVLSTNYSGAAPLKYKWTPSAGLDNDSISSPKATVTAATTYTLTITAANGATATDKVVVTPVGLSAPSIAYVAIGAANKNIINWNKSTDGAVSCYKLYKETNVTNTYSLIGTVAATSASTFADTTSAPDVQSAKYKISIVDACGIETAMSSYHKTMHLTINKGVGTVWNLIWEPYEGFSVATYYIYRGQTAGSVSLIGSLSGSNTQFSDYTAPTGDVYYQIEAVSSAISAVRSALRSQVSAGTATYTSRSNVATNAGNTSGVNDLYKVSVNLVPNPATNAVTVNFDASVLDDTKLFIFNSVGQMVLTVKSMTSGQKIQIGSLPHGVYTVLLKSGNFSGIEKLIIAQ